jgi:hypothetical protein
MDFMAITTNAFPNANNYLYSDIRPEIKSGDLLLCSGTSVFSTLIQEATNSVWSHVGFILRIDAIGRIMVLESVESIGVRAVTLSSYVNNYNATDKGYPGKLLIARHEEFKPENIINLSRTAVDLLGYPYNSAEVAEMAARITLNKMGINVNEPIPLHPRAFICSEYAYHCYKSVGITIPTYANEEFISPADFARTPEINSLGFIASQ